MYLLKYLAVGSVLWLGLTFAQDLVSVVSKPLCLVLSH